MKGKACRIQELWEVRGRRIYELNISVEDFSVQNARWPTFFCLGLDCGNSRAVAKKLGRD